MGTRTASRREFMTQAGALVTVALTGRLLQTARASAESPPTARGGRRFVFCLNTGTIRGQKLGLLKEIEVAAKAGYQAIEPWVSSIDEYAKAGGSLADLKRRISDLGLTVASAIGFAEWIVDDEARRARGLERARYDMDLVSRIGGKRIAAPPAGATDQPGLDLARAAERYRSLLELGDSAGVTPQLEVWGFSKNLSRLGQCAFVAVETGHPKACVLADVFHLYKGGSGLHGLRLLSSEALQVFHMNDYPADPPKDKIDDSFRVLPGDGVAPLAEILGCLPASGGTVLSLELFNKRYWEQDPLEVARAGLEKMRHAAGD
jgi:2-keto-myo-inositol isomerase